MVSRRTEVRNALGKVDVAFAADAAEVSVRVLDAYSERWVAEHTEICQATRVRREQSEELFDLRMHCMRGKLAALASAADVLAAADRVVVEKTADIVYSLPRIDACDRVDELLRRVGLPESEEARDRLAEAEARLARAEVLLEAGKTDEVLPLAGQVVADARAIDYPPLEALALLDKAKTLKLMEDSEEAMKTYHLAAQAAESAHDHVLKARIRISMAGNISFYRGKLSEADRWLAYARAVLRGAEPHSELRAKLLFAEGYVQFQRGEISRAQSLLHEARRVVEERVEDTPVFLGLIYVGLGDCAMSRNEPAEGGKYFAKARKLLARARGTRHPVFAVVLNNLARVDVQFGRFDEARAGYEQSISIWEAAFGPDYLRLAMPLYNLGGLLMRENRYEDAREMLERSVRVWEASRGSDNRGLARPLSRLGLVYARMGRYREAETLLTRAVDLWEKGDVPPNGIFAKEMLAGLGEVELALGHRERGFVLLERAVDLVEHIDAAGDDRGAVRFALARALWSAGRQRDRALALARTALEDYRGIIGGEASHDEVARWLAARRK